MTKIEKHKCDCCKKETVDRYAEVDWIHFEGNSFNIDVSNGRNNGIGVARHKFNRRNIKELDFCGIECLVEFLTKEKWVKVVVL